MFISGGMWELFTLCATIYQTSCRGKMIQRAFIAVVLSMVALSIVSIIAGVYVVIYLQESDVIAGSPRFVNTKWVNVKGTTSDKTLNSAIAVADKPRGKPFTTYLLIMVPIRPKSFHSREIIRDTWYKGLNDSRDVMLRFAMGTVGLDDSMTSSLATENSTHGDLIYFDKLAESTTALTNKTLLLMQWACSYVDFSYFLKCDDDTFVFVERMIRVLKNRASSTGLYYGKFKTNAQPKLSGHWIDTTWKLGSTYLPYAIGGGYILSLDLIKLIVENIDQLEWHPNEDTAVGSWLAPYKVERRDDKLICRSIKTISKDCPENSIMHNFNGIGNQEELFYMYAKLRYNHSDSTVL